MPVFSPVSPHPSAHWTTQALNGSAIWQYASYRPKLRKSAAALLTHFAEIIPFPPPPPERKRPGSETDPRASDGTERVETNGVTVQDMFEKLFESGKLNPDTINNLFNPLKQFSPWVWLFTAYWLWSGNLLNASTGMDLAAVFVGISLSMPATLPMALEDVQLRHLKLLQATPSSHVWDDLSATLLVRARTYFPAKTDQEDLVQRTLLKLYKVNNTPTNPDAPLMTYANSALKTNAKEMYRQRSSEKTDSFDDLGVEVPDFKTPMTWAIDQESTKLLIGAMKELPSGYSQTLWLREVRDYDYKTIANRMRISVAAVKTRLHRGRKMLKEIFAHSGFSNDINIAAEGPKGVPHKRVNVAIERFRDTNRVEEIDKIILGNVANTLALNRKKAVAKTIFLPGKVARYQVFLYGDDSTMELTSGQTTHAGIHTRSIHIAKGEYLRLIQKSPKDFRYLAGRIAHEAREISLWEQKQQALGVPDMRAWIKANIKEAEKLHLQFHRSGLALERAVALDPTIGQDELPLDGKDTNTQGGTEPAQPHPLDVYPFGSITRGEVKSVNSSDSTVTSVVIGYDVLAHYLKVGEFRIVDTDYFSPEFLNRLPQENLIRLNGALDYADYAAPMIARMIEHRQEFQDAVVEDIGTGNGLLAAVSLALGAKRVIGIDLNERELGKAKATLGEGFVGIQEDAVQWLSLSEDERVNRAGALPTLRLLNFGPAYEEDNAYDRIIMALFDSSHKPLTFFGGYRDMPFIPLDYRPTLITLDENGWDTSLATFRNDFADGSPLLFYSIVAKAARDIQKKRILIAEDTKLMRDILLRILSRGLKANDFEVEAIGASDGEEAYALYQTAKQEGRPFDLVITDFNMPKMNGDVLAKRLRDDGEKRPIFLHSSELFTEEKLKTMGFDKYFQKGSASRELVGAVSAHFSSLAKTSFQSPFSIDQGWKYPLLWLPTAIHEGLHRAFIELFTPLEVTQWSITQNPRVDVKFYLHIYEKMPIAQRSAGYRWLQMVALAGPLGNIAVGTMFMAAAVGMSLYGTSGTWTAAQVWLLAVAAVQNLALGGFTLAPGSSDFEMARYFGRMARIYREVHKAKFRSLKEAKDYGSNDKAASTWDKENRRYHRDPSGHFYMSDRILRWLENMSLIQPRADLNSFKASLFARAA